MQQIALLSHSKTKPLNEEIFLAQLSLRAELLNDAFQSFMYSLVQAHAASDTAIAAAAAASAAVQPRPSDEVSASGSDTSIQWKAMDNEDSSNFRHPSHPSHATIPRPNNNRFRNTIDDSPTIIECQFTDGIDTVEIHPAPIKSLSRMREKLSEYVLPSPKGIWPLAANILDPIRLSLVTSGPSHMRQVVKWLLDKRHDHQACGPSLTVCRLKNSFALSRSSVPDGYRDIKLFVIFTGNGGLKIIGEVQVHDRGMYKLKRRMHHLYRIKRAHTPEAI